MFLMKPTATKYVVKFNYPVNLWHENETMVMMMAVCVKQYVWRTRAHAQRMDYMHLSIHFEHYTFVSSAIN